MVRKNVKTSVGSQIKQLKTLDKKISSLQVKREEKLIYIHSICEHPQNAIIEGEYCHGVYASYPPFRVCKICGYAEEGWGCGYLKLKNNYKEVPQTSRKYAEQYVLRHYTQEDLRP